MEEERNSDDANKIPLWLPNKTYKSGSCNNYIHHFLTDTVFSGPGFQGMFFITYDFDIEIVNPIFYGTQ